MRNLRIRLVLFSAYFVFAILLNSVGTVILQSITSFGVTKEGASVLEGFKDLPIAIVSFLVASWLPRFGYKRAMLAGFALVALASTAMPLLPGFATAKLLFLCVGVSFALVKISVYSTIGLITSGSNQHASLMNTIEGFFMVGVLAGYWLFSAFVDPANPANLSWLNVYWVLAGLSAANILLLATTRFPPIERRTADTPGMAREFAAMIALAWKPMVAVFLISAFLYVLIEQGVGTWLPTFNNEVLDLPEAMSIQATSIFAAALAIGRLSAGALIARLDWYRVLNVCVLAMGVLVVLTLPMAAAATHGEDITWFNAPPAAYIFPLVGLFMAPIYPAINSVILSALPRDRHAAMAGLIVVFSALGGTTGSLITGLTFANFGGQTAFYLSLIPMAGILAALYGLKRLTAGVSVEPVPEEPAPLPGGK